MTQEAELTVEQQTELWLRKDAEDQGLTFTKYCDLYGIIGPWQERKIREHELPLFPSAAGEEWS